MARPRHRDKDVEDAVAYAESRGWAFRPQGHWGGCTAPGRAETAVRSGCMERRGTPATIPNRSTEPLTDARMSVRAVRMKTFEFSLIGSGADPSAEDFETRIYDSGCDDALVSFQKGHVIVDFARDARSLDEAIGSAVEAVRASGLTVERIEPDPLVSLSDIAARMQVTRSAVSNYAKGYRGSGFPAPAFRVTSETPLWWWPAVATWLHDQEKIGREVVVEATIIEYANELLKAGGDAFQDRLRERVRVLGDVPGRGN